jgi:hypothetical protein
MKILLETTHKFLVTDEFLVDSMLEEYKKNTEATLIDHKVSLKESKDSSYYIVMVKLRYKTLAEAKEDI